MFIVKLLLTILDGVLDFILALFQGQRKTEYDADFLPASEILSRWNKGFTVCNRRLTLENSCKNLVCFSSTGAGKSSCVVIPTALNLRNIASLVINDPSGEIFAKTSGAFVAAGYEVKVINYLEPQHGGFNPLYRIKSKSDIHQISEQIIYSSLGRGKEDFWNSMACSCLNIFIEIAYSMPVEYRNMHSVVSLLNLFSYSPTAVDDFAVQYASPTLLDEYKAFNSLDLKVVQNTLATVKAATRIFTDPSAAKATSYDTVSFERCREVRTVIYFRSTVIGMQRYGCITSIFFEQIFNHLLNTPVTKSMLPVFFIAEEASSLYLSSLQITASNIRKARAGILAVYQSYHQLISQYGPDNAKAFRENCFTTCLFPGQPIDVAKDVSTLCGNFEYEDEKGIKRIRPLITPDEVRLLEECLVIAGNKRAVKMPLRPYYKDFTLSRLSNLPPYVPGNLLPFESLPTLPIKTYEA